MTDLLPILGGSLGGAAAAAGLAYTIMRDRRKDTRDKKRDTAQLVQAEANAAGVVIEGFDRLVEDLRDELVRVRDEFADQQKAERLAYEQRIAARERDLIREIGRLRREVRLLREILIEHGIAPPIYAGAADEADHS